MVISRWKAPAIAVIAVTFVAVVSGGIAIAAIAPPGKVKVCVTAEKVVRAATVAGVCPNGTTMVEINIKGRRGEVGPPGPGPTALAKLDPADVTLPSVYSAPGETFASKEFTTTTAGFFSLYLIFRSSDASGSCDDGFPIEESIQVRLDIDSLPAVQADGMGSNPSVGSVWLEPGNHTAKLRMNRNCGGVFEQGSVTLSHLHALVASAAE